MSQPEQQQTAQAAGKKGKKKKGTTISLTDFLGDAAPAPATVVKSLDWADESEEFDGPDLMYQSSQNKQILSSLPTGPRSSRTIEVDMTKLPNEPPFTAFVGNLPYEVDEEMLSEFFKDLKIVGVRLPEENGRFKGYGYVEFADRHSLAEALQHNEETFNRRQIRVDVAGSKNQGDNRRGNSRGYGSFGTISMDGPDVTESDWRKKSDDGPSAYQPPSRGYGESDYRSDRGSYQRDSYQRDDRYGSGSRDYGRSGYYGETRSRGYGESDYRSDRSSHDRYQRHRDDYDRYDSGSRGYGRSNYSGERRYRDSYQRSDSYGRDSRGYGRDQDNGYGQGGGYGGGSRDYGGDRSYGSGGYGGGSGYGGSRDYGSDRSYGSGYGGGSGNYSDRNRDYQSRDQGYGRSGYDRSDGYGGGSRSYGGSSGYGDRYDSRDSGYGRDRYQDDRSSSDFRRRDNDYVPAERKPSEDGREESHPPSRPTLKLQPRTKPVEPAEGGSRSSIFGGAKPVDTAAREKEIEEKLKKEKDSVFQMKDEREEFKRAPRRSSERSDDGHHSPPRRPSRRISSDKDYNDAHRRRSTSPGRQQEDTSPKDKPSSQSNYKPAPAPKQSAWGKGPTTEKHQQAQRKTSSEEAAEVKKPVVRPAPPPASNPWSRGPPKIDSRGVREEAEGNAREDDLNERTPEGAADDTSRGSDGSAGDGSDRRSSPDRRTENKPRQYGDGRRDDGGRGQPRRQQYEDQSDYRRRGDGGSGKRNDWDRERPAPRGYDGGRGRPYDDRDRRGAEDDKRVDSSKKRSQEKRDSSRDSRPECDRSAAVGQEQDFSKSSAPKGRRQPKVPPELEPEPVIEFVQKSKFSALPIEDDVAEDAED